LQFDVDVGLNAEFDQVVGEDGRSEADGGDAGDEGLDGGKF